MHKSPKVTIPMACYNAVKFIEAAIKSVSDQTYENWELIIVDDGSKDKSYETAKKCIKNFGIEKKTQIYRREDNICFGYTLREAIEFGDGEIIAPLDADDVIAIPKALSIIVSAHNEHPEVSMVHTNYWKCHPSLKKIEEMKFRQKKSGETYLEGPFAASHWKTFKREMYDKTDGIDATLLKTVDKDLILKLEEVGDFFHIPQSLYMYRQHKNNLTLSKKPPKLQKKINIMRVEIFRRAAIRRGLPKGTPFRGGMV